ncbi:MAG: nitrilase-related carbon-nitrogen hydrolase, partial [bacterium]
MEKKLRIALAQINPTLGDLRGNTERIRSFIMQAQELKADIITFPELAICGYPPEDLLLKPHFVKDNLKVLDSLLEKISGITAVVGFVDMDKMGNLHNAAGIIDNG